MPYNERKRRKDGNYQASITIGKSQDGKPMRKVFYAKSTNKLDIKVTLYKTLSRYGMLPENENMTFGELVDRWKDAKTKIGFKTCDTYMSIIRKHLLPELSHLKVSCLKAHHLQKIIDRLAKSEMRYQLKEIRKLAIQILNVAMSYDIVFRNVFKSVKVPRITITVRRPLTKKMQNLVYNFYAGHRMGIPALFLLFFGIRKGELIALTWKDVDIENKSVIINKAAIFKHSQPQIKEPKTEAGIRSIPIPEVVISIIKNAKENAQSAMVCPSAKGKIMSASAFRRAWDSYLHYLNIKAGGGSHPKIVLIDNITAHMFRHTYATILYNSGIDVESAQVLLGHSNIETTLKIYMHLEMEKKTDAIACLNKYVNETYSL